MRLRLRVIPGAAAALCLGLINAAAGITVNDEPDRVHWVQLTEVRGVASPEAMISDLTERRYSPVFIYPSDPQSTIRVGLI
jgi:hypothetical protein